MISQRFPKTSNFLSICKSQTLVQIRCKCEYSLPQTHQKLNFCLISILIFVCLCGQFADGVLTAAKHDISCTEWHISATVAQRFRFSKQFRITWITWKSYENPSAERFISGQIGTPWLRIKWYRRVARSYRPNAETPRIMAGLQWVEYFTQRDRPTEEIDVSWRQWEPIRVFTRRNRRFGESDRFAFIAKLFRNPSRRHRTVV